MQKIMQKSMQKVMIPVAFVLASVFFTSACKELDKLTQFEIEYSSTAKIGANSIINLPIDLLTPDITTNSQSEFSSKNTNKDLIEAIKLLRLNLQITSPTTQRFDFLKSVEVYIKAEGLGELKIAEKLDVPDTVGTDLSLDVKENDLAPYIKKDKFSLRLKVVTDKSITQEVNMKVNSTIFVDAKLL